MFYDLPPAKVRSPRAGQQIIVKAVAAAVAAAAAVALATWQLRPARPGSESSDAGTLSTATPYTSPRTDDTDRLLRLLPAGYPPGTCTPTDPPDDALAAVVCTANADWGGPASALFTRAQDQAALAAAFREVVEGNIKMDCPGRIQSPGPWRRKATSQAPSGTLFCGVQGSRATVAWTTDADGLLSVTRVDATGPNLDRLYRWWSTHS